MEALEISKKNSVQSNPSCVGGEEVEDIPDMGEYEEADNLIETDPVRSCLYLCVYFSFKICIVSD